MSRRGRSGGFPGALCHEQAILLKNRRPAAAIGDEYPAALRRLQPEQDAQECRLARTGAPSDARDARAGGERHVLQHGAAFIGFCEVFCADFHHAPTLSASLSTANRNSFSNSAEISTITAVHANRSGVWK